MSNYHGLKTLSGFRVKSRFCRFISSHGIPYEIGTCGMATKSLTRNGREDERKKPPAAGGRGLLIYIRGEPRPLRLDQYLDPFAGKETLECIDYLLDRHYGYQRVKLEHGEQVQRPGKAVG